MLVLVNSILHKYGGALALSNQFTANFVVPADMHGYDDESICASKFLFGQVVICTVSVQNRKYK